METVKVRRRWNTAEAIDVAVEKLWDFHFRNDAGGVCGAFPRAFLAAHAWCDHLPAGALGHQCREGPPPHDMVVVILPNDNPQSLFERLRGRAGR